MYVFAFDIDGTLTPVRSSWWYVKMVFGLEERFKNYAEYFFSGLISYEEWVFLELRLFKGLSFEIFNTIIRSIPWRQGVEELVNFRRTRVGDLFIAVTGGFGLLGERAVKELGFDDYIGVELKIVDGKLTGYPISYIDFHGKGTALLDYLDQKGVRFDKLICIGDNVNDVDMFRCCDISIAFCPSRYVKKSDVDIYIPSCSIKKLVEVLKTL
ncbi:MAG: HAD family phosphatase [Desulfurococcaceae archaeon]|jgi:phosphoserine phosphatase|nr:HAD family phosphatase [Desulfurococcaceae archaeon]